MRAIILAETSFLNALSKEGFGPEFLKFIDRCNCGIFTVTYIKSIHFRKGNVSQNKFLASNFPENADFLRKTQKNHFFSSKFL